MNQLGVAQSVGGVHHKVEGFFRTCVEAGGLTGTQGCIVPASNADSLVLDEEVTSAIAAGTFSIWTAESLSDALKKLLSTPTGEPDDSGDYPPESIFGRVQATLRTFNDELNRSERFIG